DRHHSGKGATGPDRVQLLCPGGGGQRGARLLEAELGEFRVAGSHGISPAQKDQMEMAVQAQLSEKATAPFQLDAVPSSFRSASAFPAREGNITYGFAVLFFTGAVLEAARASANYLSRHLGLALRNLDRFTEVEDLAYLDDLTHLFNVRYLDLV